jgi:hypothetical protein
MLLDNNYNIFLNVEMGGNCIFHKYFMKINFSKYIKYLTNMCWNGQSIIHKYTSLYNSWKVTKWRKKQMGQNKYLNLLHNPTNFRKIYEWNFDVPSQEFKTFRALQQMLNFIPTPCAVMNELFREPTKHDHLQDVIHMFTLHIHPMATQRTYQQCHKINTRTSREISINHIISLVIWKNTINSSIPKWKDINRGENNALGK